MDGTKVQELQKRKFIRNTVIVIVCLIIAAFILNLAPGYKRNMFADKVNLVINEDSITEGLADEVYVNLNGTVYLSKQDMINLFDNTLYYNSEYDEIITALDGKTVIMGINQAQMRVNDEVIPLQDPAIKRNGLIYIPVSEMGQVYNIEVKYVESTNTAIIDELNKGQITANVSENIELKHKPRILSKTVAKLIEGEKVYCCYASSNGWRQVRTENGEVGYVKENKLVNQYIVRQDTL
ncbi:MAG: copper amine oxidase N-terminal domain-containing protein [Firmicutes bacterium]|nr:copper amine oxidase N-terminal domain-containing protein [Bacillota bacterium]